jgi:WD40 repeat protein
VALTADGSLLACGRGDGTVELRDPVSLDVQGTLAGLSACVLSLRFSPSARTLAAGDDVTGLCSWDLGSGRPLAARSHELGVKATDISWLPDESGFLVTGLTRVVGLFTPDGEFGEHVWFDNLNVRYFQGAALVDERTLAVRLEESRRPEQRHPDVPESACVMIIDFGADAG